VSPPTLPAPAAADDDDDDDDAASLDAAHCPRIIDCAVAPTLY